LFAFWFTLVQFGSEGFGEYEGVATKPDGLGFFVIVAAVLPLIWRRRAPFAVFVATLPASVLLVALGYAVHVPAAPAVALYTFFAAPRRANLDLLILTAIAAYGVIVLTAASALPLSPEEYVSGGLVWLGACIIGDRRRTAQQNVAQQRQLAVADERARIARELHDSAGHAINTIRVHAGAARVLRERDPERAREAIEIIEQVAQETAADIDRIVGALRGDEPAALAPAPGVDQIAELVARAGATLHEDGDAPVPQAVSRAAYRIAQETLTNAAKHGSGDVEIRLTRGPDALELTVVNAVTAEPAAAGGGRGLLGMRERATLLGGSIEAGRADGRFRVRAVLPYDRGA
ncbi:MAG TPA: histidine kinase, partial [Solirubrobacteraceae bacterium]